MATEFSTHVPPQSHVEYHKLPAHDPRVLRRIPIWVRDSVTFCKEAANFHPHWYQEILLRDNHLFICACWSRQIGKSEAIAHKAIHHAFTKENAVVIIIAPGQRQAKELYKKIVEAITRSPLIYNSVVGKIKMEETLFANNSRIINLPSGDEGINLRGYTITLLVIDESAFVPDAVFVAVEQGLSSSGGQQICISTPRGRHNSFFRMFFPEEIKEHFPLKPDGDVVDGHFIIGDWSCHHYEYTVGFNVLKPDGTPQLSEIHVMRQKRRLPAWQFRSEYLAQFVENLDSFFRVELIERMFNSKFSMIEAPAEEGLYFMGIDIAKGRDFTAIAIGRRYDIDPFSGKPLSQPHIQICKLDYWKNATIEENYPYFMSAAQTWGPMIIFFDKTSMGERPYEELRYTYKLPVEGIHGTQTQKVSMFGTLNMLMSTPAEIVGWDSRIQCYQDGEAIKQFRNMIYELGDIKSGKTGRVRKADNVKIYASHGHDDIPISVALLCLCISGAPIVAPLASIPKPYLLHRDAKVSGVKYGFPTSSDKSSTPVAGFGKKGSTTRKHTKVFW